MTFAQWVNSLIAFLNTVVVPSIFALAFLVFIWGVFKYFLLNQDSDESRAEGRSFILWGILGMVLLFGVWGVVNLLITTLGLG